MTATGRCHMVHALWVTPHLRMPLGMLLELPDTVHLRQEYSRKVKPLNHFLAELHNLLSKLCRHLQMNQQKTDAFHSLKSG